MANFLPLDRDKVFSRLLDPKKVKSITFTDYEKNPDGTYLINKNRKDIAAFKRVVSLTENRTNQGRFNEVIDIEFKEFVNEVGNNALQFLDAKLSALNSVNASNSVQKERLRAQLENLAAINEALRAQLENANVNVVNKVPNFLSSGGSLFSDRPNQNTLLSENRTARLVVSQAGNVVTYKGNYDENANPIGDEEVVVNFDWAWDGGATAPNALQFGKAGDYADKVYFLIAGLLPTYQYKWVSPLIYSTNPGAARLVLDDGGHINVYDGQSPVWTTYGLNIYPYFKTFQQPKRYRLTVDSTYLTGVDFASADPNDISKRFETINIKPGTEITVATLPPEFIEVSTGPGFNQNTVNVFTSNTIYLIDEATNKIKIDANGSFYAEQNTIGSTNYQESEYKIDGSRVEFSENLVTKRYSSITRVP